MIALQILFRLSLLLLLLLTQEQQTAVIASERNQRLCSRLMALWHYINFALLLLLLLLLLCVVRTEAEVSVGLT